MDVPDDAVVTARSSRSNPTVALLAPTGGLRIFAGKFTDVERQLHDGPRAETLAIPAPDLLKTPESVAVVGPAAFG